MEKQLKLFFEFLENDKKLSKNTLQSYKRDLKQFRRYIEGCEVSYNKVDEEVMQNYIEYLEELGKKPSTISRCIASIRSFYQYVLKKGKVKKDPTRTIKSPKVEKRTPCVLTSKEVEKAIKNGGGSTLTDIAIFDVYTGVGVGLDKKSMAYSLTFSDNKKTLTDDEVNALMNKIIDTVSKKCGAELRK